MYKFCIPVSKRVNYGKVLIPIAEGIPFFFQSSHQACQRAFVNEHMVAEAHRTGNLIACQNCDHFTISNTVLWKYCIIIVIIGGLSMMEFRCSFLFIQICKKFKTLWREFRNLQLFKHVYRLLNRLTSELKHFFEPVMSVATAQSDKVGVTKIDIFPGVEVNILGLSSTLKRVITLAYTKPVTQFSKKVKSFLYFFSKVFEWVISRFFT